MGSAGLSPARSALSAIPAAFATHRWSVPMLRLLPVERLGFEDATHREHADSRGDTGERECVQFSVGAGRHDEELFAGCLLDALASW